MEASRRSWQRAARACAITALAWTGTVADAGAVPVACGAKNRTLFSCSAGKKAISVCASRELDATAGWVQYRFGRPDAAELRFPDVQADWRAVTRGGTLMFSGGGGAFLAFARPPLRYVVYTASGRGWGPQSGVVVERDGRRIANVRCVGAVVSRLGPSLFGTAGIAETDEAFEVPQR